MVWGVDRFRGRWNFIERLKWWIYCGDAWKIRLVVRQSKNLDSYNDIENLDDNFIELREYCIECWSKKWFFSVLFSQRCNFNCGLKWTRNKKKKILLDWWCSCMSVGNQSSSLSISLQSIIISYLFFTH
jgi:hypothetical protein